MATVFVHGVPETAAIWDGLRAELDRDSVALALPGFGAPRPSGFGATMDEYVDWLVGQLEAIDESVDLVGHDWGGILTARIATAQLTPLRSWVSDSAGAATPEFVWHDLAKTWQTPDEGEAFFADLLGDRAQAAELLAAFGVPPDRAPAMVAAIDDTMVGCILDLYRSAVDIARAWGHVGEAARPGLVIVGADDPLGDVDRSRAVATSFGAEFAALDGAGHWWPLQSAAAGARALEAFWARHS
jgi:pimeloyl-ACP methyl ester carboxylesterase